jgi:hypothetical protein
MYEVNGWISYTYAEVRGIQHMLGAVKQCRSCERTLPISKFYVPTDNSYKGWNNCAKCERQRTAKYRKASA